MIKIPSIVQELLIFAKKIGQSPHSALDAWASTSSLRGNRHSLFTVRLVTPDAVFRTATRATPSPLNRSSITLARGHFMGGKFSSLTRTKSLTTRPGFGVRHLERCRSSVKYSSFHPSDWSYDWSHPARRKRKADHHSKNVLGLIHLDQRAFPTDGRELTTAEMLCVPNSSKAKT